MKSKVIMFLFAVLVLGAIPAQAQVLDGAEPDTVVLVATRPTAGDTTFKIELYFWNDSQTIVSATMGFGFDNDNVNIDSAYFAPGIETKFDFLRFLFFANDINQSNDSNIVACQLGRIIGTGLVPTDPPSRQLIATYWFSVSNWDIAQTITFDTLSLSAGTTYKLNDPDVNEIFPIWAGPLTLRDPLDAGNGNPLEIPKTFSVAQNYPNPFNPTTTIEFALPVASDYSVKIYNVTGRQVKEFKGVAKTAGEYSVEWDASDNASGVYFYKVAAGDFSKTMKMMLLK
jgi:hypothetical protein